MSDVTVSVVESTTSVTVSGDVVDISVVESPVTVSTGTSGPQGASGVGYTGVTSTSSVPVSIGLHTWTVANVGAFLPGMRIRAIHTDTPSIWLEGPANVASGTTIIITADKVSGSGTHNTWKFAVAGEIGSTGATGATGATGPTGPTGVVTATAPVTYDSGTQTVGINQAGITVAQSQVTNLVTDLAGKANLAGGNALTGAQTITGTATASVVATVTGASGQTANLQEWVNGGTIQSFISPFGAAGFGTSTILGRLSVNTGTTGTIGAVIRGVASQTANLQEWQNSAGTVLAKIDSTGIIQSANAFQGTGFLNTSGQTTISIATNRNVGLATGSGSYGGGQATVFIGNATTVPTSNPTGGGILYVDAGALKYRGTSNQAQQIVGADGSIRFDAPTASTIGAVVKGAASQTANLQQWQNSAGTVQASMSADGTFSANGGYISQLYAGAGISGGTLGRLNVAPFSAAQVGAIIRGAASQTANLQEWQNSAGSILARVASDGQFVAGQQVTAQAGLDVTGGGNGLRSIAGAASVIPIVSKGAASQTANLLELQNSAGTILSRFTSTGLYSTSTSPAVAGIQHTSGAGAYFAFNHDTGSATLFTNAVGNKGLVIRGAASQTANLQEWQNSGGTVVNSISATGTQFWFGGLASMLTANSGATLEMFRMTAQAGSPGANRGRLYFRDGTTAGTLKLVVRAGAAGAETTILDNIPQ